MGKIILVVDDDTGILEAFQAMLESENYNVEISSSGEILTNLSPDTLPDLIILDVLLSGKDGRDICNQLKKNKLTKKIPIIMISAHPNAEQSTLKAGADAFLKKPFDMDEMLEKVAQYVVK